MGQASYMGSSAHSLESYLEYALGFGIALGIIGFVIGWWRSLPCPECPWFGPDLRFPVVGLFLGISVGLIVNYTTKHRHAKTD